MLDQKYLEMVKKYAQISNLDERLVLTIIDIESSGNPNAVSRTGCTGLMQLSKAVAKDYGVSDRLDPEQNIRGGCMYLRACMRAMDGNVLNAGLAYNQGIRGAQEMLAGTRPFVQEGEQYVQKLKNRYML